MSLGQFLRPYTKLLLITLSGYTFVFAGLLSFAFQLNNEIHDFTSQTNKIYQHPFQVNAAARISRQSITTLRNQLLYGLIDQSNIRRDTFVVETDKIQTTLADNLNIIQTNFLGDMTKVTEAISFTLQLQRIQQDIIELLINHDITNAEKLIKNQATPLYQALMNRMDYIVDYSSNKAANLVIQAQQRSEKSHTTLWILFTAFSLFTILSGCITATMVLRNLFNRDSSLRKTHEDLRIAATAFETQEGMLVTDTNNKILRVNRAFSRITGYDADEVLGQNPSILSSGKHKKPFYLQMWKIIKEHGYWEGEVWDKKKNGDIYPQKLTITAVTDNNSVITNYVGTICDITLNKQAEKKIADLAYFDPLTRLPNRRLLMDRLNHSLLTNSRHNQKGALLFLDLDNFKTLNDTLGHDMGDILLKKVAKRLVQCIRESDTVSRFGGDEFVILIEALSGKSTIAATQSKDIAKKILASINLPYQLNGHDYSISTSIGITLVKNKNTSVDELLKQADIALYKAKDDGRNSMRFFDPQMQANISNRVALEAELNHAIENKQFELYYQVQVDKHNNPLGAEALLRWNHPNRSLVPPVEFIPVAEQNGSIISIGHWVLDAACAQLQLWQQNSSTESLTLAINVSARQFLQDNFVATIKSALTYHKVRPELLKLELTESILLNDIDKTIVKMNQIAALGIQFSLDDFGTGYSSLQYLKKLPLFQLKIDKSFVDGLVEDKCDQEIVRTIIAMAHNLGLTVIAEGVEDESQRQILSKEGCSHYQGYLCGKPETIDKFEARFSQPDTSSTPVALTALFN
ncbi:putative bifunctional diguanylate cyclase/phosphodiesterase [Shewanella sp. 10N.286.51.B2]|uniref:putative bifunctional diguanylate cyclase/phosphodiesterase n=1 Tax=Shewanella sp. 10N.286.51.B2 TaxID=3229707 RepID=UPI00354EE192